MIKKMKLADIPFGKNFEVWGHTYTVLDNGDKSVLVLEVDSVCKMPFREDGAECKVAPNDFRDSSVYQYLAKTYLAELVSKGADLGRDIRKMEIDLKCTLGRHEYGTARVYAGLLTLEQYGKYYDIIPRIDTAYWLATPWKTPSRVPYAIGTSSVWYVSSDGNYDSWYCNGTFGVRPTLALSSSLLVSVECDEHEAVDEDKWHAYLEYMIRWVISHSDKSFVGCMPASYDEWLNADSKED